MTIFKGDETYRIIQAMKATGNQPGVIERWKSDVAAWANMNRTDPDATAVNAWLPLWQPRPFYTADELAPLWPALAIATGVTERWPSVLKSARRLEFELDFHKLPRLPDYEKNWRNYFIVERIHYWRDAHENDIRREINHAFG